MENAQLGNSPDRILSMTLPQRVELVCRLYRSGIDGVPFSSFSSFYDYLLQEGFPLDRSSLRRYLISGGIIRNDTVKAVSALFGELTSPSRPGGPLSPAKAVSAIALRMGISKASVYGNLPYFPLMGENVPDGVELPADKGQEEDLSRESDAYNLFCPPPSGEDGAQPQQEEDPLAYLFKVRAPRRAVDGDGESLLDTIHRSEKMGLGITPPVVEALWRELSRFQGHVFRTSGRGNREGVEFTYRISGGELFLDRKAKSITRSSIGIALAKARGVQLSEGHVSGPKKLGTFGASYLYPIFMHLGIITP